MSPLKLGIVSFAHHHAGFYMAGLGARDDIQLLSTDPYWRDAPTDGPPRGRAFADARGVAYVDTYDELLAWGPDAVMICSENTRHASDAIRAAEAGAHVLVEKPMATTVDDARAMIAACEAAGVRLMVSYPMRFTPMYESLRALVRDGGLGRILGATGTNNGQLPLGGRGWFTDPALSGGGALMDLTVHIADLLEDLLEEPGATSVYATSNTILHGDNPHVTVETGGLVTIRYSGGEVATIDCSWSQPDGSPSWGGLTLQIVGTEGVAEIDPFAPRVGGFDEGAGREFWLSFGVNSTVPMIDEFLSAIREGRQPQPSGEIGLRSVAIAEAAQRSAIAGAAVVPAT